MKVLIPLLALLVATPALARDCEHTKDLSTVLDSGAGGNLAVLARAGLLEIHGDPSASGIEVEATACASKESVLERMELVTRGGSDALVEVVIPDSDNWGGGWNNYAYVDLVLRVPQSLALKVQDSSGPLVITQVASLDLADSSGDIEVSDIQGPVSIKDSSGDIDVRMVAGNTEIRDSSGDMRVENIRGDFTVLSDSSGGIRAESVEGTARVINDSSGDIRLTDIGVDAIVERDSSGSITVADVRGDFVVERDGGGSINSRNVSGAVRIPVNK